MEEKKALKNETVLDENKPDETEYYEEVKDDGERDFENKEIHSDISSIPNVDFLEKSESFTNKIKSFSNSLENKAVFFGRNSNVAKKPKNSNHGTKSYTSFQKKNSNFKNGMIIGICAAVLVIIIAIFLIGGGNKSNNNLIENNLSGGTLVANKTFDAIQPIVSGDAKIESGTEYAYMSDSWNVYIAKAVSSDIVKIEHWDKTSLNSKNMKYSSDLGSFRIGEGKNGFSWVDDGHTAFTLVIQDKYNSKIKKPTAVVFTININDSDKDKGTDYDDDIACYSYKNDEWHTYRAIRLTDTLIKIECWYKTSSFFFSSYRYAWDVGVIDTKTTRTDFAWGDTNYTAFTITMKDSANESDWEKEKLTSFILDNENYKHSTVSSYLENLNEPSSMSEKRTQKNAFDSANNESYKIGAYTVEIPKYWESENKINSGFQRYAETDGKVAMLQVVAQTETDNSFPVTFDGLVNDNNNMIAMIESTAFKKVTDYETIDTGVIKGILYKGVIEDKDSGLSGYGEWFAFASEKDRTWCTLIMCQTDNTEYLYTDDFMKIIKSIKPVE